MNTITAGVLEVAYHDVGPAAGAPVILLHGFPYDGHAYDEVTERLVAAGRRCIVPFLRGFGPTRFLAADTPRSGEQAALGADLLALMDALAIPDAVLAGYDWGGRAACIVAALWPDRTRGLVSCGAGYNIQNIAAARIPVSPEEEYRYWYQYYFHSERGRAGLTVNRHALCRLIWRLWSCRGPPMVLIHRRQLTMMRCTSQALTSEGLLPARGTICHRKHLQLSPMPCLFSISWCVVSGRDLSVSTFRCFQQVLSGLKPIGSHRRIQRCL
jgi:pimeloyl-ACP methyl ester carboxylesterase